MFEALTRQIKQEVEQVSHINLEHMSTREQIHAGAALALGAAAYAISERFHLPQAARREIAFKAVEIAGLKEMQAVSKNLTSAEWLASLPKSEVARVLSPHLAQAESLSKKLSTALHEDGDVNSNIAKAMNEHSAEHFPYVKPITVQTAEEDDAFMTARGNSIFIHGNLEHTPSGAVQLEYKSSQAEGEAGLIAALGHEYTHVEQNNFLEFSRHDFDLTEGKYQRGLRIVESLKKDSQVELQVLKAENEFYALRAVDFAGRNGMREANAIKPANFAPYYDKVMSFPRDEMPPSFAAFVDKQNALRSSLHPAPSDHDIGRQFFIVMRGQIATAKSRALMTYNIYQNLYHEREAFQMEDAIKTVYGKIHLHTNLNPAP